MLEYPVAEEKITFGNDPFEGFVVRDTDLSHNKLF